MIQKIKAVRWPIVGRAFVWTAIWLAVFALEFIMSWSLAGKQPVIFGIIMVSVIIGSVCLAHAILNWHSGAWGSAMAALAVGIVAIAVHSTFNVSFWSSVATEINEQVMREKAANAARDIVAEKRKERYANSASGKSAAQIDAELKAMEFNDRWTWSKGCTDATASASRSFCTEYFMLKGQRDGAMEAGKLEGIVWNASTSVETEVKRNLAAAAHLFARWFGGEAEDWTGRIVVGVVLLIQLVLAFAFVIGYAPDRRQARATAAKLVEAPTLSKMEIKPPRAPLEPRRDVLAIMAGTPGNGGGGNVPDEPPPADSKPVEEPSSDLLRDATKMVAPDHPKPVLATADGAVTDDWKPNVKPRTKAERLEAVDVITRRWLDSGAATRCAIAYGSYGIHVYNAYSDWCASYHIKPVNPSHFGRSMRRLKVAFRKEANGVRYGLRVLNDHMSLAKAHAKMRRAAA